MGPGGLWLWGRGCLVPPGLRAGHRVWLLDPCQAPLELREAGAGEIPGEDQNQQGTERIQACKYSWGFQFDFLLCPTGLLLLLAQLLDAGVAIGVGKP